MDMQMLVGTSVYPQRIEALLTVYAARPMHA